MIFSPEGNRTITGEMSEFKKGGFHFAKATNATIVPIGIVGAFKANVRTSWIIRPGRLKTIFGTPITPNDYSDLSIEDFRDLVRNKIVNLIKDFS
jgi:1-acyl-sn-glycerol-3-phosphate acyltransferase